MAGNAEREFTWYEGLSICLAMIGVQLSSEVIASWGNFFYSPPEDGPRIIYVSIGVVASIFVVGRVVDLVSDPLIGLWSDHTKTNPGRFRFPRLRGRRRPFIFWGAVLMTLTNIAFWFPPVQGTSWANLVYAVIIIGLHWGFFTLAYIGVQALGPEIARSERARVKLGVYIGVGLVLGLAIAYIVPPILVEAFRPEVSESVDEPLSPVGFQRMALVLAFVSLALFMTPVLAIRERYDSSLVPHMSTGKREFLEAIRNRPFQLYFAAYFLLMIGQLAVQKVLPYWAVVGLGGSEDTVSLLMGPYILTAILSFPLTMWLARKMPLKWVMFIAWAVTTSGMPGLYVIGNLDSPVQGEPGAFLQWWMGVAGMEDPAAASKTLLGAILFAWSGIGQGMFYVLIIPLIGEIIDWDEQQSGERREALYNGFHGVAIKSAQALSIVVANASMSQWGNSVAEPEGIFYVGLIASVFGVLSLVVVWHYPVLQVTKDSP